MQISRIFSSFLFLVLVVVGLSPGSARAQPAVPAVPAKGALDVSALRQGQTARLAVVITIPPKYHAQSNTPTDEAYLKTELQMKAVAGIEFGTVVYPAGKIETYPALGKLSVYSGKQVFIVPVTVANDARPGPVTLSGEVTTQICDDETCFPPGTSKVTLEATIADANTAVTPANAELFPAVTSSPPASQPATPQPTAPQATGPQAQASPLLEDVSGGAGSFSLLGIHGKIDSVLGAFLAAVVAGLLFNVMPCVLPVLPLKAIGFYEASRHDRRKSILFGFAFSVGVIAVFGVVALAVIFSRQLFGTQFSWGQQFSSPLFMAAVIVVLVALGIAMLGVVSVRLPSSVYGLDFRHDTLGGNFMWGGLTAILSTPCTAPLFPIVIGFAITQSTLVGVGLVLAVGGGMALPYFLLSAFPQVARRFPRTGPLGEIFKQMLAFLMFGTAAFFLGSAIGSETVQVLLICAVAVAASIFLVVRTLGTTTRQRPVWISLAFAVLLTGITVWTSFPRSRGVGDIAWVDYSPAEFEHARTSNQLILVKFTAKWCANCIVLDKTVYREPEIIDALHRRNVVAMKLDVDKSGWDLLNHLAPGAGIPYTAIYLPRREQPLVLASMHDTRTLAQLLAQ